MTTGHQDMDGPAGDVLITGGTVFDGRGGPGVLADVLLRDGRVQAIGPQLPAPEGGAVIDAADCWVTPGFIDIHTHYDAELEATPDLVESVRHGVTTVRIGSCGLSLVMGEPEDLADMFCRVEGIPRDHVLPLLERIVDWKTPAEYLEHLDALPLGPNLAPMLGHSTIRAHVMGLERSVDADASATDAELDQMRRITQEGIEAGYVGLSLNALPLDKMDGTRVRSYPTPSVRASFREYRMLANVVRRYDAVLQALPDVTRPWVLPMLMGMSTGLGRRSLRSSLLTLIQSPQAPQLHRGIAGLAQAMNRFGRARIRMQALPCPFDLFVDGIDAPVFEEFAAGTEALHLEDLAARQSLMRNPRYRKRFIKQWRGKLGHAYHRNLALTQIISCPDGSVVGKSFSDVATERGVAPVEVMIDLAATYGRELRWRTVAANSESGAIDWIVAHPVAMIGFSDAGAHLRNMAFHNIGLLFLKRVQDAERAGRPLMSVGEAVHKLSGDISEFFRLDTGVLAPGRRGDVVVIDPAGLDERLEAHHEADMPGFAGVVRMVRRNDDAVRAVLVNGRLAWTGAEATPEFGRTAGFGQVLRRVA